MDSIKKAFQKVKQDTDLLREELNSLREGLVETREIMIQLCEIIKNLDENPQEKASTYKQEKPTPPTYNSTHIPSLEPLKDQNIRISIGNEGVPTDRQTNQQTNRHIENEPKIVEIKEKNPIDNAADILDSLDGIKKEIRLKFKRLTEQEMLIFSTLYQIEEEQGFSDYKSLSRKLKLTESSIRDYVGRLIKKGIPVEKNKINNKNIQLNISKNLKKIVSLPTILQLRDL